MVHPPPTSPDPPYIRPPLPCASPTPETENRVSVVFKDPVLRPRLHPGLTTLSDPIPLCLPNFNDALPPRPRLVLHSSPMVRGSPSVRYRPETEGTWTKTLVRGTTWVGVGGGGPGVGTWSGGPVGSEDMGQRSRRCSEMGHGSGGSCRGRVVGDSRRGIQSSWSRALPRDFGYRVGVDGSGRSFRLEIAGDHRRHTVVKTLSGSKRVWGLSKT